MVHAQEQAVEEQESAPSTPAAGRGYTVGMRHHLFHALVLVALTPGCGGCGAQTARIASLEAELDAVRADLDTLEAQEPRTVTVTEPSPEAEAEPAPEEEPEQDTLSGRLAATRAAVVASDTLLDEVDEDLAALEDDLDEHDAELEALHTDVEKLSSALHSQSDAIAGIADELELIRSEAAAAQDLAARFSIEGGAVVLEGGDLILRQGTGDDGRLDGTGRIYTQAVPGQRP